jgi:hypothetical protein
MTHKYKLLRWMLRKWVVNMGGGCTACSVTVIAIPGVESSGSSTRELINLVKLASQTWVASHILNIRLTGVARNVIRLLRVVALLQPIWKLNLMI